MASSLTPRGDKLPLSGSRSLCAFGIIDRTGLLQKLLALVLLVFSFEVLATFVLDIVQLVKNAALLDHGGSIDPGDGLSQLATPIANHRLQALFRTQATFP